MTPTHQHRSDTPTLSRRGFTLVELTIVVTILAILAAIVIPKYQNYQDDARIRAIQANLRLIKTHVDDEGNTAGQWPADLDASWFINGEIPTHAHNSFGATSHQVLAGNDDHPGSKVLKAGVAGAYWYNPDNGIVRARVADQGSEADTLAAYNEINGSTETDLGNYSGGGGGGS